jgi:flagellar basal body rod protein FlgG
MSSGIYSALTGARSRLALMDTISQNLSNSQTPGFKKAMATFEAQLDRVRDPQANTMLSLVDIQEGFSDQTQGTLRNTGIPTHLAISGSGFFRVQDQDDSVFYTRQGAFHLDPDGFLMTANDMRVLGEKDQPMQLEAPLESVDTDGTMLLANGESLRLPIYAVEDPSALQRKGGSLFYLAPGDETPVTEMAEPELLQGRLEESNVKLMQEMSRMMEALRTFESCQKMIKTYNTLAGKRNQLGTVS